MRQNERTYRLQVRVSDDYERAIEDFRFRERLPSRAAAIRELLRRGLARKSQENSNRDALKRTDG
jgi:Arc/MetJ-type ribon-helix-helix transcriptional regulator